MTDLELSYSSSEFEDYDEEDQAGLVNGIRPFQYEPSASEDDTTASENQEEDLEDENEESRIGNTDWCTCGHCKVMTTAVEGICCSEVDCVGERRQGEHPSACISIHPGFQTVCLDVWVLQSVYFILRQHYGSSVPQGTIQQQYRHTSYRQLVNWCWGYLGNNVCVPLPSCAVSKIRETFPSDTYTGFKYPALT